MGDGQAGNGDRFTQADVEHAAAVTAVHCQHVSARAINHDIRVHGQLAAGQPDGTGDREVDHVKVIRVPERLAQ